MQVITLTDSESGSPVVLNAEYLISVSTMQRKTLVVMRDKVTAFVKESPKEIAAQLSRVALVESYGKQS